MKRLLLMILLAAFALSALCACGGQPAAPADGKPAEDQAPNPQENAAPTEVPQTTDGEIPELTDEEIEAWETGGTSVPDLGGLTEDEIVSMYLNDTRDEGAFSAYEESLFSPELFSGEEDYPREEGEWTDYDPGDWTPGEDIIAEFDIAWDSETGGETGTPNGGVPEEYAFLLPDGLRDGDIAMEENGEFILSLPNRTKDDYDGMLRLVKDAGYTQGASEIDTMGIVMYEASNGATSLTLMFQNGRILASFQ